MEGGRGSAPSQHVQVDNKPFTDTHEIRLIIILLTVKYSSMLLKGSLLALLIVSVCADDHPIIGGTPNTDRSPDNSDYDDVDNTVTYSNRRRYGGGKPTQVSSSVWASGRARTDRVRAKAGRRRRWGRPARTRTGNNSRVRPSGTTWGAVQESYSSGSSSDSGYYNAEPTTESYNSYDSYDNDYDAYQNDNDGHQNDYDDYDGYQNDYDEKQDGYNGYDKDVENYQTCTKVSLSMHAFVLLLIYSKVKLIKTNTSQPLLLMSLVKPKYLL